MYKQILNIINLSGFDRFHHIDNLDDYNSAIEFNPDVRTLARISFPIGVTDCAGNYMNIERWSINPSGNTVIYKRIFSGECILYNNGTLNNSFYINLLKNLKSF